MLTALTTALSALNAQATAIDVVGNNLANLDTTGFKAQSTEFYDLVSQTMGGGSETQIGMGVGTPITERVFSQGSITSTSDPLDVAIQGNGFLVTQDSTGATLYTRAGNLTQDANGTLTDADGNSVQGWSAVNGVISTSSPVGNITIPEGSLSSPVATQNISLSANLDSSATSVNVWSAGTSYAAGAVVIDPATGHVEQVTTAGTSGTSTPAWNTTGGSTTDGSVTWKDLGTPVQYTANQSYTVGQAVIDPAGNIQVATAAGTSGASAPSWNSTIGGTTTDGGVTWTNEGVAPTASNASLSQDIQVYDSVGNAHSVTVNFWKGSGNNWDWQATVPGSDVGSSSADVVGSGSLAFNSSGQLTSPAAGSAPQLSIKGLADGANNMTVNFNMFKGSTPTVTQFAQTSASSSNTADGSAAGQLTGVSIGTGGTVVATYSNGQQVTVAQLAMANFTNPDSLLAVGNNSYQVTGSTSNPSIGLANTGGRGQIEGSALESSTADIATEFTNLMVNQRSYEANSKVVTTADQMEQDVIQLIPAQ